MKKISLKKLELKIDKINELKTKKIKGGCTHGYSCGQLYTCNGGPC